MVWFVTGWGGAVARAVGSIQIAKGLERQTKNLDLHPEGQGVLLRAVGRRAIESDVTFRMISLQGRGGGGSVVTIYLLPTDEETGTQKIETAGPTPRLESGTTGTHPGVPDMKCALLPAILQEFGAGGHESQTWLCPVYWGLRVLTGITVYPLLATGRTSE